MIVLALSGTERNRPQFDNNEQFDHWLETTYSVLQLPLHSVKEDACIVCKQNKQISMWKVMQSLIYSKIKEWHKPSFSFIRTHSFSVTGIMKAYLQGNAFCINASVTLNCKWTGHIPLVVYIKGEYSQVIWLKSAVAKIPFHKICISVCLFPFVF